MITGQKAELMLHRNVVFWRALATLSFVEPSYLDTVAETNHLTYTVMAQITIFFYAQIPC
jgi:hypothetical protein